MTLRVTPWGKDDFKATSEEAESKDWAYWQNRLNRASLVMLAEEGIIDKNIVPRIAAAQKHAEDLQNLPGAPRLTDIMPLEKMLIESCGEEATLIHTGRSRQDMFTTLNEARLRLAVLDFYEALNKLRTRLLSIARENIETYIPAYTNGVQAMPITLAFYLWGFLESFQRDSDRIIESYKRINQSALGVAVLACSSWPLNRERLAELLGFEKPITNGLDAAQISLFDIPLEAASNAANVAIRIGTLVQDLAQQYSQTRPWLLLIPAPLTALQRCRKNAIPAFSIKLEGQQATLSALCRHLFYEPITYSSVCTTTKKACWKTAPVCSSKVSKCWN